MNIRAPGRLLILITLCLRYFPALTAADATQIAPGATSRPLAIVGARILPSPEAAPIPDGGVVIEGGKIIAFGSRDAIAVPKGAEILPGEGRSVLAGFWNCHVHFTEPKWQGAGTLPAGQLTTQLQEMLTSYGFTTAVDLASEVANTIALRQRIASGEVTGPRILTAGLALYPEKGIPYYLTDILPPEIVSQLFAPATPEEAVRNVEANVAAGADMIKVFLVTGVRRDGSIAVASMRPEVLQAAVKKAHELGRPVIAHPSYLRGLELTIEGGVDILAHTTQDPVNWTDEVVSRLRAANVALVPTLTLFSTTREFEGILREVKSYADAGGELLFGTDIGFLTHYSELTREYEFLGRAGLRFPQVLAMLTTAPAKRFDRAERGGRIAVGAEADLVVVNGDPSADLRALAQVRCTIRNGRVIYRSPE